MTHADDYLAFLTGFRYPEQGTVDPRALMVTRAAGPLFDIWNANPAVYQRLVAGLPGVPDPFAAGVLAVQLGGLVESGADPAPLGEAMTARLPPDFAAARRFGELLHTSYGIARPDDLAPELEAKVRRDEPAGAAAWDAQKLSVPAAMAVWCRHAPSRRAAARVPGLLENAEQLANRGGHAYYVSELLRCADGVELVVLAPEQQRGFVVELLAVRNAAHLFALLEATLVGDPSAGLLDGPRLDPEIAAIARGEQMLDGERTFSIGWHYEYWFGVRPEAAARSSGLHPMIAAMIGVEASVAELPAVAGRRVVLMRPGRLGSRICDVGFFAPLHDALRSAVVVRRVLPAGEVGALLTQLTSEAAAAH